MPLNGSYGIASSDPWADFERRFTTSETGLSPLDNSSGPSPYGVYGNFGQFMRFRYSYKRNFTFGISIGGYSSSDHFSLAVRTDARRKIFVTSIVQFVQKYRTLVDRVDIDWEYPSNDGINYGESGNSVFSADSVNFGYFLRMLRTSLNLNNLNRVEISICTAAEPKLIKMLPYTDVTRNVDTINIMTYDFKSSQWGDTLAGHHTNLYSTSYAELSIKLAVDTCLSLKFPASKIVIGVAAYSRGFANTSGLGQSSSGTVSDCSGACDYRLLPRPNATEYFDKIAVAGYSYDPVKRILNSYDTVQSVIAKARYIWNTTLRGYISMSTFFSIKLIG